MKLLDLNKLSNIGYKMNMIKWVSRIQHEFGSIIKDMDELILI